MGRHCMVHGAFISIGNCPLDCSSSQTALRLHLNGAGMTQNGFRLHTGTPRLDMHILKRLIQLQRHHFCHKRKTLKDTSSSLNPGKHETFTLYKGPRWFLKIPKGPIMGEFPLAVQRLILMS